MTIQRTFLTLAFLVSPGTTGVSPIAQVLEGQLGSSVDRLVVPQA